MMKYIFWDFNGTILDDVELCYNILNEMLTEEGRPNVSFESYLHIFTFPVKDYYAKVYDFNKTSFEKLAHRFIERYQPRSLSCPLHHGVIDMISYYEKLGYVNVLLSASEEQNLLEQLIHFNLKDKFTYILGTKDIYAKTKEDVAKRFIEQHHIDPNQIIMIGDTLHDAEIAKSLGCRIIIYTKGHQHPSRFSGYQTISSFEELKSKI